MQDEKLLIWSFLSNFV